MADGATLRTVTVLVYSVLAPSLSRTLPCTVRVPSSVVGQAFVVAAPYGPYPVPQSKA